MNIDELFRPEARTASQQLKTQLDSDVETLAGSFDEINDMCTDTLMSVSVYSDMQPDVMDYLCRRAKTFRRDILSTFRCIDDCSKMLVGYNIFNFSGTPFDSQSDFNYVAFSFRRRFKSPIDIIRLMNTAWGWFSRGTYCHITFYRRGVYSIFDMSDPLTVTYDRQFSELFLARKRPPEDDFNNQCAMLKDRMLNLTYMVTRLMKLYRNSAVALNTSLEDMMTVSNQPDSSEIHPYNRLCDYFGTNPFETNFIDMLFRNAGINDNYKSPLFDCKTGQGILKEWDGYVPLVPFCNASDTYELGLLSVKRKGPGDKIGLNIDMVVNKEPSLRNVLSKAADRPGFVSVRQVSIYRWPDNEYDPMSSSDYMLYLRLAPVWSDDAATEMIYKRNIRIYDSGMFCSDIAQTLGNTHGEKMCNILEAQLNVRMPMTFSKDFDNALERIQEYQLKQQILYHGRNH